MKTPTEMAIDYLSERYFLEDRIQFCQWMIDDLESLPGFKCTGAFDDLEREIDKAIEYLESELKEMRKDYEANNKRR